MPKKSKTTETPAEEPATEDGATKTIKKRTPVDEDTKRKKARAVARRRGYRTLSIKAGYSNAASNTAFATAAHVLRLTEVTRAIRWKPEMPDKTAYGDMDEFTKRLDVAYEPVARSAAHAVRAGAEVFLRSVVEEAVLRTYDMGKTRVSGATMWSVLRPYSKLLKMQWSAPRGLVRHGQTTTTGTGDNEQTACSVLEGDEEQAKKEAPIVPKQVALFKAYAENEKERKEERKKRIEKKRKDREETAVEVRA